MIHRHILYGNWAGHKMELSRAEGSRVFDTSGKDYIDFTSGWNVANLGWNHPEIIETIKSQLLKGFGSAFWNSVAVQSEYAEALTSALPPELNTCIRATSGTEAVEVAIKVARSYTRRNTILGFSETYHGQLFASMALGTPNSGIESIGPVVPHIEQLQYPISDEDLDPFLEKLEARIAKGDVAALVSEPGIVTGWGTVLIAAPTYLKRTSDLLQKYEVLLIIDEVGTGFSRTGSLFGINHEDVVPDMLLLGKAIANGSGTMATTVIREKLSEPAATDANLTSTFGWNPLSAAAALKTLEIHKRDRVWESSLAKGEALMKKIKDKNHNEITMIRGRGLEIAVEMKNAGTCASVIREAQNDGLLLIGDGDKTLQLMPPLTISEDDLFSAVEIFFSALDRAKS